MLSLLVACNPFAEVPLPYPDGCEALGPTPRRCAGIVEAAGRKRDTEPVAIALLPPEADSTALGGHQVARVVLTFGDGRTVTREVTCVGIPGGPTDTVCQEPSIAVLPIISHDVPCSDDPAEGCPDRIVLDPAPVAAARPLRVATLDIPIDGPGHKEVWVGELTLPNGYVTTLNARVVNSRPTDFWIDGMVFLELRPADPWRPPFGNVYLRPLIEGVEPAELWVTFEVTEASDGAVLHLADIVAQ